MSTDTITALNAGPVSMILWQSLAIFLIVGALMGIVVSLLLLIRPQLVAPINRLVNRWVSTHHLNRFLDRSINIEQWFYRHHRLLGVVIAGGACYMLGYFGLWFNKPNAMQHLSVHAPDWLLDILLDALVLTSLIGAGLALFVGLFLWLRPSLLRSIEAETNRWISSRRATEVLDAPHQQVEHFVAGHLQRVGWLLLVGSTYLLFAALHALS